MLNNIKSFGLNVIPDKTRTIEQTAESVENAISGMWEPILGYLKENENVFSGQVDEEISRVNNMTMRIGMSLNQGNEVRNINFES